MLSNLNRFVSFLKERFPEKTVAEFVFPEKEGEFSYPATPISPEIVGRLSKIGIEKLYHHQVLAIDAALSGKNVIVVAGTSGGKTLAYLIPVLNSLYDDQHTTALLLYPTKALAQDQLALLVKLAPEIFSSVYDGDTPLRFRKTIREKARIVLSNIDMLHFGILPNHHLWANFLRNLKYVVIDEAHVYRGAFGSNASFVLKRLERLTSIYQGQIQYLMSTATLSNPKEQAEQLTGRKFYLVVADASRRPKKTFLVLNPPFLMKEQRRSSANLEATAILVEAVKNKLRTIVFSKSKMTAELIASYAKNKLKETRASLQPKVATYRAGYLAEARREIEKKLFEGSLLGVSSTSALELGVDVGDLEVSIINGFPGTISSFHQQTGRAGRKKESLTVYVAGEDPLDQYYAANFSELFEKPKEAAIIDVSNPYIIEKHILCAAHEKALSRDELVGIFGEHAQSIAEELEGKRLLSQKNSKYFVFPAIKRPHEEVSIRTSSSKTFQIINIDTGEVIEFMDEPLAYLYLHPGAVYLHQAETYLVLELDVDAKIVLVQRKDVEYYTLTREDVRIHVDKVIRQKRFSELNVFFGQLTVVSQVLGFVKKHTYSQESLGSEELFLPPHTFETRGLWFTFEESGLERLDLELNELAGGIHGIEHAHISLLPVYAGCDRWDIGGVSTPAHFETDMTTVFVYDGFEGGLGYAEKGYKVFEDHIQNTCSLIEKCPCKSGCPSCVQSPKCGNLNEPLDKKASVKILRAFL